LAQRFLIEADTFMIPFSLFDTKLASFGVTYKVRPTLFGMNLFGQIQWLKKEAQPLQPVGWHIRLE
jgi:hypothetical protein